MPESPQRNGVHGAPAGSRSLIAALRWATVARRDWLVYRIAGLRVAAGCLCGTKRAWLRLAMLALCWRRCCVPQLVAAHEHAAADHTTCTASDESPGHRTAVCVHGWFRRLAEATRHHMPCRERGATNRTALPRSYGSHEVCARQGSSMWSFALLKGLGVPGYPDANGTFSRTGHGFPLPYKVTVPRWNGWSVGLSNPVAQFPILTQFGPSASPPLAAQAEGSYGASIYDRAPPARAPSLWLPGQSSEATEPSYLATGLQLEQRLCRLCPSRDPR